jgi:hypothetical protein
VKEIGMGVSFPVTRRIGRSRERTANTGAHPIFPLGIAFRKYAIGIFLFPAAAV